MFFPVMHLHWLDYYSTQNSIGKLINMDFSSSYFMSSIGDLLTGLNQSNVTNVSVIPPLI